MRGQAMVETLVLLPVILLGVLLVVQLIWLLFATATFRVAVSYSVRAGSLNHGERAIMERTLTAAMASLELQFPGATEPQALELQKLALLASARQWLHFQLTGKLQVHRPKAQVMAAEAERRYDLKQQRWVHELAVDHPHTRMAASNDPATWQQQRMLDVEVWWCLPLQVPLANRVVAELKNQFASAAQRHCWLRGQIQGKQYWALEQRLALPLLSGYRQS
ncbi:hypothetical protein [Pseudidiomarina insulisalsae]|uniref:Pilus assembly protein TadE n=1 Tax=Pseudidiomarina insulisalsae TaxID=575789 RepID=A0A432YLW4_9GAMM|nr:hypothetical protein [Pseudidiomarina insulisalsae]RUO61943.1 hypothetical protein CWI71_06200 [Pseudidiomarina insulisalsae]